MRLDSVDPAPAFVPLRADQTPAGVVVEKERLVVGLHPAIALRAVGQIGRHLKGGAGRRTFSNGVMPSSLSNSTISLPDRKYPPPVQVPNGARRQVRKRRASTRLPSRCRCRRAAVTRHLAFGMALLKSCRRRDAHFRSWRLMRLASQRSNLRCSACVHQGLP
jgi:hypothetical protein